MGGMELARLLDQPDERVDLGFAALLLARTEYPSLDLKEQLARLDALAREGAPYVDRQPDAPSRVDAFRIFLAETCGFRGNEDDYYDPKNSFLNHVLDRRTGIPITLSVVYMEVGRRLGISLLGVGLPGHFLVKCQEHGASFLLDPFNGGRTVNRSDCRDIVEQMYQGQLEFRDEFLAAVDKKYIVVRMLNNLRGVYLQHRQYRKALWVVETLLSVHPASGEDIKLRGMIHYRLQNHKQAREDLEAYLFLSPEAPDAEEVKETLTEMKRISAMMN